MYTLHKKYKQTYTSLKFDRKSNTVTRFTISDQLLKQEVQYEVIKLIIVYVMYKYLYLYTASRVKGLESFHVQSPYINSN